jgi:hypothetical protein
MKIRPVEAELLHTDGRNEKDTTKLTVASPNSANAPKTLQIVNYGHDTRRKTAVHEDGTEVQKRAKGPRTF